MDKSNSLSAFQNNVDVFQHWLDLNSHIYNRLYYRDQSLLTLSSLMKLAEEFKPTVIVELGTLAGFSLRAWIASTRKANIVSIDLSFKTLKETMKLFPADLSRVFFFEQDILKTDFTSMWGPKDKVIFFVDAHDLPNVFIMDHILTNVLPRLPDGSLFVVDDLWFSEERLTSENAKTFFNNRVLEEIDELQCFTGHYAPYHESGAFMGFAEVIPLLEFVNAHGIKLVFDNQCKHVSFKWNKKYLKSVNEFSENKTTSCTGSIEYNPLDSVPVNPSASEPFRHIKSFYHEGKINESNEALSDMIKQDPEDEGLCYGLAVCLARLGHLSEARDVLEKCLNENSHLRYKKLHQDLVRHVGASKRTDTSVLAYSKSQKSGLTIFAMPKPFNGHNDFLQKNAIRSWTLLHPKPDIILFGNEPGVKEIAAEVGARHIPEVCRNEFGTPLVNKLFESAQEQAHHEILAYVNADIILFQDFIEASNETRNKFSEFLLIGQRWDLNLLGELDFNSPTWKGDLMSELRNNGFLHAVTGLDYFVFPKGMYSSIPPFAIGRTAWDNWLAMFPHKKGIPVIDGTEFITAIHQEHDYAHLANGRQDAWNGIEATRNKMIAGKIDGTGFTSNASLELQKNGVFVEKQMECGLERTNVYKKQRSYWLLKQAAKMNAAGWQNLARNKYEEFLTFYLGNQDIEKMLSQLRYAKINAIEIIGQLKQGEYALAEKNARYIFDKNPYESKWIYNVASKFQEIGDLRKARRLFKEIIKQAYTTDSMILGLTYFKLAEMDFEIKQFKKALLNLHKCLFYYPDHEKAKKNIIKLCRDIMSDESLSKVKPIT